MRIVDLPPSTTQRDYVQLGGGLDLLTPTLAIKPGYVRDALNWEQSIGGGYSRCPGYERFDGRAAPSAALYFTMTLTLTGAIVAGNTIIGNTSAATGTVLSIDTSSGVTVVAYTQLVGNFTAGESIKVGAPIVATGSQPGGAGTAMDYDAMQRSLAANVYRALIAAVPGSGPVRGGFYYGGLCYAFRNNAGGTALALYKSSAAGWVLVPYLFELAFTAGTNDYVIGDTVTQGAVSATVRAVALQSGAWTGTAAGRLIITAPSGGNFAAGASAGGGAATLSGIQTAITMLPGGRVQTDFGNFDGTVRVYGCDGLNRGWEFDGTTLAPITTGNAVDTPTNVLIHKDHVWFSFATNLQNSGITTPFNWTAIAGSVSYRFDALITSLQRQPGNQSGGAMSVSTETSTEMIYGSSKADFQKVPFEQSAGARLYGGQRLGGQTIVFGNLGVMSLAATQAFGNFEPASMTMKIRPFTQTRRNQCTASLVNKEKSQYRVFFNDGYGLYLTILNGRHVGSMPVYFPNKVTCAWQGDSPDGIEGSFSGSDNGMVYRLDSGTSHDGASIDSFITPVFVNQGNSRILKRYRRATFEVQGDSYARFDVSYEVNYGAGDRPQGVTPDQGEVLLAASYWDAPGATWDNYTWDGKNLAPDTTELAGTGNNIALRIDCNSDKFSTFTINSVVIDYSVRRGMRTT